MIRLSHRMQERLQVESVWCEDCGEIRPVTYDRMPADERNDHDAIDILCDRHHIVATLHHPTPTVPTPR
jgi:hypothetical protein